MDKDKNLLSLQILRGIAATSVVYLHLFGVVEFGAFGVDIFFVLSGFVIAVVTEKGEPSCQFAVNRIARIVPLYWILTTVLFLIAHFMPGYLSDTVKNSINGVNYVKSLFFIPYFNAASVVNPVLAMGWTLNYEMLFYATTLVSLLLFRDRSKLITCTILGAAYLVASVMSVGDLEADFLGSELIFEFFFGLIAFSVHKRYSSALKAPAFVWLAVLLTCYGVMAWAEASSLVSHDGHSVKRLVIFGLPSFVMVLAIVSLEESVRMLPKTVLHLAKRVGDASYSTYLSHWFVIVGFRKILAERLLVDMHSAFGVCLMVALCLAIGQVIHALIDQPLHFLCKKSLKSAFCRVS